MKRILTSIGLGLLGVLVAVGVTMAAGNLSSQSIGISAEPTTAGEQLAVPVPTTTTAGTPARRGASPKSTSPTTQTQPMVDDDARADEREDRERERDDRSGSDDSRSGSDDRGGDSDNSGSGSSGSGKDDDD